MVCCWKASLQGQALIHLVSRLDCVSFSSCSHRWSLMQLLESSCSRYWSIDQRMFCLLSILFSFICRADALCCESLDSLQCVKNSNPSSFMTSLILTVSAMGIYGRVTGKSRPYILEVHQLAFHSRCNAGFGLLNTFSQLPIISPNKTGADCMISFSLQVFLFRKTCFKCNTKGPNEVKRLIFQIKNRPGMGYGAQEL